MTMTKGTCAQSSKLHYETEYCDDFVVEGDLAAAELRYEAAVNAAFIRYDQALTEAEHDLARAYERAFCETVERCVPE